jgi:hypothetical protein
VAIPNDIAGIVHAGHTNTLEEYALLDRLGTTWQLRTFDWVQIERTENQWDFEQYDRYVDTAKAAGKKVLGVLAYGVPWIFDNGNSAKYIPPDKMDYFLRYVRQTVKHFEGRVDAWCIWNEPNTARFWKGTRQEFFELTRLAADAAREADPGVILLGGAFTRGVFGLPAKYINGLFEAGAMDNVDAVAFHPYELNPARTEKLYRNFRKAVAKHGFAGRIWVTETGYPTGGRYPTAIPEKKLPEYTVKTFVNLAVSGTPIILWYQLFDRENRKENDSEDFFGLVRSRTDYSSKGAEAFRLCAVYLSGTVYRPELPRRQGLPRQLKAFYFERPGGGALVMWKEGRPLRVRVHLPGSGHTMHDPVSGDASVIPPVIPPETVLEVGAMPVFITWQDGEEGIISLELHKNR